MKVSDYIADFLVKKGINTIFGVVGGGAMHLDDSFAHCEGLKFYYNHHEQASAIAAESYARVNNNLAVVSVTTGPGGTNALTGVLCAWQDSIPLLVISGQVRTNTMVDSTGLELRQFGEQEHYIIKTVKDITKYSTTVIDKETIRYHLERAIYEATHGRRGPCWIDIPLDIQGAQINPENLVGYVPETIEKEIHNQVFNDVHEVISKSKRPVIIAGSAIRTAEVYSQFREFTDRAKLPVVVGTAIADLFPNDNPNYYGNFGIIGGRCGNFMVQNADCIIVLGCRMAFKHIGFNYKQFSPNSVKIVIDVDKNELSKKTLKIDYEICADLKDFFEYFKDLVDDLNVNVDPCWIAYCNELKKTFPIYKDEYFNSKKVNPYYFAMLLKKYSDENMLTVVGNSCACDCLRQCGIEKEGQRIWGNTDCGTMGYDLPAAIGAAVAAGHSVNCVTGDGSIQMNIQELQTIVYNKLPIKIFIHSNGGYYAIVQTHENFFGRISGCTSDCGISMPDFSKLAFAYGIPYYKCHNNEELAEILPQVLKEELYCICEIDSDTEQQIEPKCKSKILDNGDIISPPIDDLYPFLERDIYDRYANFNNYKRSQEREQIRI